MSRAFVRMASAAFWDGYLGLLFWCVVVYLIYRILDTCLWSFP